ncbi:hypothetical protein [Saccharibacillus sacchari]|uniref:hypothetical protein n=1 Tax=Saccharibacillus sacchari TaxID=456493 RepID=UPI0004B88DDB|nr:hypothetical protein [Saccharibacillus sacchari]
MYKRLMAALGIMALLGGCGNATENASEPQAQTAKSDTAQTSDMRDYEGEGEAWSAEYSMYVPEDGGRLRARLTASYEGTGPAPVGEVKYSYYGVDIESGSGGMVVKKAPENGVYLLRDLVTTEYRPDDAGSVELLLIWNNGKRSETIRLEPAEG